MHLHVDPAPRPRDRPVIGPAVVPRDVQGLPQAPRIGRPPRHCSFRLQALEVAEQQPSEVATRRQRRLADPVGVELRTLLLDEGIEADLVEQAVQTLVERMARAPR